jgi:hypothetical protein
MRGRCPLQALDAAGQAGLSGSGQQQEAAAATAAAAPAPGSAAGANASGAVDLEQMGSYRAAVVPAAWGPQQGGSEAAPLEDGGGEMEIEVVCMPAAVVTAIETEVASWAVNERLGMSSGA